MSRHMSMLLCDPRILLRLKRMCLSILSSSCLGIVMSKIHFTIVNNYDINNPLITVSYR